MSLQSLKNASLLRLGGIAGIVAVIFLPGVILQIPVTGWFPEYALEDGTMSEWLTHISTQPSLVFLGIGLSILSILTFMPFGLTLYRHLPRGDWARTAALAGYGVSIPLSLVAFVFAYGFTWALLDLNVTHESAELTALSTLGMRGFLVADDLATCLIGLSNALFALAALRAGFLPKWLCWWGLIVGLLVTLVLLRYFIPAFVVATAGYPLLVLWFVLTGIQLLRKRGQAQN